MVDPESEMCTVDGGGGENVRDRQAAGTNDGGTSDDDEEDGSRRGSFVSGFPCYAALSSGSSDLTAAVATAAATTTTAPWRQETAASSSSLDTNSAASLEHDLWQLNVNGADAVDGGKEVHVANVSPELNLLRRRLWDSESVSSVDDAGAAPRGGGVRPEEPAADRGRTTSIRVSIDKIRKQASKVDAALALDRLETIQMELEETKRLLSNKKKQVEEQRCAIRLKDDRLATLELERDLYRADARLVINGSARTAYWRRDRSTQSTSTASDSGSAPSKSSAPIRYLGLHREAPPDRPSVPEEEASYLSSHDMSQAEPSSSSSSCSTGSSTTVNHGDRLFDSNVRRTSALEATCLQGTKRLASIIVNHRKKTRETNRQTHPSPRLPSIPGASNANLPSPTTPRLSTPTRIRVRLPEQPEIRRVASSDVWLHSPPRVGSLGAQVGELQDRLRASVETADELRRRLAAVHGFYERTLRTLQARWEASHQHRHAEAARERRIKLDRAQRSRQRAVDALEAKLREKDDEIERLSTLSYNEI